MNYLSRAIAIAAATHDGQKDKAGKPYIFHPLRVMLSFDNNPTVQAVAVLHDALEDSRRKPLTYYEMKSTMPAVVFEAVVALTHNKGEPRETYIRRVKANRIALAVKQADIRDNMDPFRMSLLSSAEQERLMHKYGKDLSILLED